MLTARFSQVRNKCVTFISVFYLEYQMESLELCSVSLHLFILVFWCLCSYVVFL